MTHSSQSTIRRTLLGSVSLLGLVAGGAQAQTSYQGGANGAWSNAANWSAGVPTALIDTAVNNGQTVLTDGADAAKTLTIGSTSRVGLNNNTSLTVYGNISNAGGLALNSVGNLTDLIFGASGTSTLSGNGTLTLSNSTANRIYGLPGSILSNFNNTISGAGEIGVTGSLALVNQAAGVIDANQTNALTLDGGMGVTNAGVLRATNTGGLRLVGVVVANSGGQLQANGAGARVDLQGATIKGGTLSTSGGGVIQSVGNGTLDGSSTAVVIAAGSTVQAPNNSSLTILGTITNRGSIALNSVGNLTDLIVNGPVTLNGGGTVALSNNAQNRIYGSGAGAILTNVDNTIAGGGEIGLNGNLTFRNQALVDANAIQKLTIDAPTAVQNTGTIRSSNTAVGNGGLLLQSTTIDNTGSLNAGQITAIGANTHVDLQGATISGGTLTTSGGGLIQTVGTGTLDGRTAPVTISAGSTVQVNNNTTLNLLGTINAQGVINLASVGNLTDLVIAGGSTVRLVGPGGIVTSDNAQNRVYGAAAGAVLVNVDSVISGAGELGLNGNLTLRNEALVDANRATALRIDATTPVQNIGTLRSSNTSVGNGGLVLTGTTIDNTGSSNVGKILADGLNTHVDIVAGTRILGGTLTGSNGGVINVSASTLDGSAVGAPLTVSAGTTVNVANNTSITLSGAITNAGTVALNSVGNLTDLIVAPGGATLSGGGRVLLSDNAQNRIYTNTAGAVLENVDNTISGAGQLFPNAGLTLKNGTAGVINATGAGALSLNSFANGQLLNVGLLESTAGTGGLSIGAGSVVDNTGNSNAGRIVADGAGTHVDIVGNARIVGGTLTGSNGGVINVSSSTLDGSAVGAPLTVAAGTRVNVGNNSSITLSGAINNAGTVALNSAGNLTDLLIAPGGATLSGGGKVVLSNNPQNRIYSNSASTVLTNTDNIITGAGQIFANAGLSLVNGGIVDASQSNALTLSLPITNAASGVLRGSGSGGLVVNAGATTNNGEVAALNGSAVTFNGSASLTNNVGGTLTGGTYRAVSTGGGATVSLVGGAITTNAANLVLDGAGSKIQAGSAGSYTDIQTTLATNATGGQLHVLSGQNYATTNNLSNAGLMELGGGTLAPKSYTNSGTTTGFGTLAPTNGSAVANSGTVAANGGTLTLATGIAGTGTLRVDAGATASFAGAPTANTVGTLAQNGTLALGTSNVTVSSDYTNAGFGTGNAFDKRAGVTGTGQILASGNVAHAITGAKVTNGTSAAPTLALGEFHAADAAHPTSGGTASFNIANTGTTGPALRGAIQTTGVTNPALFGTGVNAQNWGPVAAGATSGPYDVTVATAGALTGQSIKVVNNFSNVADQTVALTGVGYNYAKASVAPTTVNLGNFHVGATPTSVLTIGNTAPVSAFSEKLDGAVSGTTGSATASGGFTGLAAGGSSTGISVGLTAGTGGAKTGTVNLGFTSNAAGVNSLGNTALAGQAVTVNGTAFNLASSSTIAPVSFGVLHVGTGVQTRSLSITNTAPTGAFSEGLDSAFGTYTNTGSVGVSTSGSIVNLAAGSTDASSMKLSVNTTTAGVVSGTVQVKQTSNGTASGLGNTALADQNAAVSGTVTATVTNLAAPQINTAQPVAFGNVRVGSVASQALSISNTAPAGAFTESLVASAVDTTGGVTASGGFGPGASSLAPQGTNTTGVVVGIDTSTAGSKNGAATLRFGSDGTAFAGGVVTDLGTQDVAVTGAAYRLASPTVNTPSVALAARVGGTASGSVSITNTSPDAFTEGLKAGLGAAPSGFTSAGAVANLVAGGTDSSTLKVALNTATAGTFGGSQAVTFASTGAGTTGAADAALTGGSVAVSGKVYAAAVASVSPNPVNFGTVHVGDTATKTVTVGNTAAGALTDVLTGGFGTVSAGFTGSGTLGSGVAAGSSGSLSVALDTGIAGSKSGSAGLLLASHNADLADVAVASAPLSLLGKVNNYAVSAFGKLSGFGSFSGATNSYTLDFGNVTQGALGEVGNLYAYNFAAGLSDLLGGFYQVVSSSAAFSLSGFDAFGGLGAGQSTAALTVGFDTGAVGSFSETIRLVGRGSNDSGYDAAVADTLLVLRGSVVDGGTGGTGGGTAVPEPGSLAVLASALAGLGLWRRRRAA